MIIVGLGSIIQDDHDFGLVCNIHSFFSFVHKGTKGRNKKVPTWGLQSPSII